MKFNGDSVGGLGGWNGGVDRWERRKEGGLESKVKLNTGPDLGVLRFEMAGPITPPAGAAQAGSFGVTESERRGQL